MGIRRTIFAVCMASIFAAASLPAAASRGPTCEPGASHDSSQFLTRVSGPTAAVCAPLRNPQHDLRESRLAPALPGVAGLRGGDNLGLCGQVAAAREFANLTPAGESLLSLHCLLVV